MRCPHECQEAEIIFNDCINEPGAQPDEGSVGICYYCGGWWELKNGKVEKFTPTQELLELAMPELPKARARFKEFLRKRA